MKLKQNHFYDYEYQFEITDVQIQTVKRQTNTHHQLKARLHEISRRNFLF